MSAMPASILDIFITTANDPSTSGRRVIECGSDAWTYAELEAISNAMAHELKDLLGLRPKVAFVGENHPYVFALMLAVWKIGGIFIPIDAHVPPALLAGMLDIVKPACMYLSAVDVSNVSRASELPVEVRVFHPENSTIPTLNKQYGRGSTALGCKSYADEPCLYLFTSSASSKENLKAVPLTPKLILSNCQSKLAWWREIQPTATLDGTRVLGWAPWSHVLSHMQDIGTATFLAAGCYVFASVPSSYRAQQAPTDLTTRIIDGVLNKNVTALAALPFVISGMKDECEGGSTALIHALRGMAMLECGGAALDPAVAEWYESSGVPLMVGIGMTETGGAIFAGRAKESRHGFSQGALIADAKLSLDACEGAGEGELVVKSKLLPNGYIGYNDGSFSVDSQGWVTFKTRDRYRMQDSKFLWLGRATDYIQMTSGESLDPRPIEKTLRSAALISDACIIGDTFLRGASTAVCAIVELSDEAKHLDTASRQKEVARVLAPINAASPPALRISMASVLILNGAEKIPRSKKGDVFRKKIEDVFGKALKGGVASTKNGGVEDQDLENEMTTIIGNILGVSDTEMLNSMTFAELGMTSVLAVKLTATLNEHLAGRVVLPANICYIHLDAPSLVARIRNSLSPTATLSIPNQQSAPSASRSTHEEIVIVGKSFRLPGGVNDDATLWAALMGENESVIAEIPSDRWDHASFYPADICVNKAGLIEVASYDHSFFGISATEAYYVSPTMRVALEVAFEALEDANIPVSKVKGTGMGVFVATKDDGFETLLNAAHGFDAYTRFYGTGRAPSTASGRISYLLDTHGPSVTVDTACSGGIVCIDQAVAYLQSGAGESAIVCSSNTHCWPGSFMFLTAQNMASPNSRCASFTSEADGYVPSEGAVAFILKTRSAAERDGDRILATVKATEVSHNGRSQGLAAPNVKAQAALHRAVLRKANIDPRDLNFIETHGTGTTLGDLCEVQGINESFVSEPLRSDIPLIVSASKAALGHTEPSAGLVGMLSVLMTFQHGVVPGLLHLREDNANKQLDLTQVPLLISPTPVVIETPRPHRAAVLSYGFSGTLADIVLEGPAEPSTPPLRNATPASPMIFVVSAKTSAALTAYIDVYLAFLRNADDGMFHSICYTSCVGREHYKHRFACVAADLADLIQQVQHRANAPNSAKISTGTLAFAFPGQGTNFPGMAAALANNYPILREFVVEFGRQAQELSGGPITKLLLEAEANVLEGEIHSDIDQICIFVYQYSMCRWLKELDIEPTAVIGHSLGEITAALVAGALTFEVALDLVVTRGRLLRPAPGNPGGMAALACSEETIPDLLEKCHLEEPISISVINGPRSLCVSGASNDIEEFVKIAKEQNVKATRLRVDQGFHSPRVESASTGLRKWATFFAKVFRPLRLTLYSTALGGPILRGNPLPRDHWADHIRNPVLFSKAAAAILGDKSVSAVLDIGPQTVAWSLLLANGCDVGSAVTVSGRKDQDQQTVFLSALAALYQNNKATPNFDVLYAHGNWTTTAIPTYPFQRVRRYPTFIASRNAKGGGHTKPVQVDVDESAPHIEEIKATKKKMTSEELRTALMLCVREALEILPKEELDDSESLVSRGIDSITFSGLRKRVEERYGLNLPILFWSDAFSVKDIIDNLVEQYTTN